jgi:hypothetical protein
MKSYVNDNNNLIEIQNSLQQIFRCNENIDDLQCNLASTNAEDVLLEHLFKAIRIVNTNSCNRPRVKNNGEFNV